MNRRHLAEATRLGPDQPAAWHDLGQVRMEQGRALEAREAFGHCARLDAKNTACRDR